MPNDPARTPVAPAAASSLVGDKQIDFGAIGPARLSSRRTASHKRWPSSSECCVGALSIGALWLIVPAGVLAGIMASVVASKVHDRENDHPTVLAPRTRREG